MKRWAIVLVVGVAIIIGGAVFAVPYTKARLSYYSLGGQLDGRNILLTCLTSEPILVYGGGSFRTEYKRPLFGGLETLLACRAVEKYESDILADSNRLYGGNRTLTELVERVGWCFHPSFSDTQIAVCEEKTYAAIDWMIEAGTNLNPPGECGYLPSTVLSMDEEMFAFLLSRGADPEHLCPPASTTFGPGTEDLIDTKPKTVAQLLEALLDDYTDEERQTVVAGWTRMLQSVTSNTD